VISKYLKTDWKIFAGNARITIPVENLDKMISLEISF
jgi:hypothetical protein